MTAPSYDSIRAARTARLTADPFDPHKHALMSHNSADGLPSGFITLPDMTELSTLSVREGMDLLARIHDEDLVEEWIHDILALCDGPENVGLMLVNVIRNLAPILASHMRLDRDEGIRAVYRGFAFDAWDKNFDQEAA